MVLKLNAIAKAYPGADGPIPVLKGVDLALAPGETLALTGESGSGKSTLLHIAAGLEVADDGQVNVDGHDLAQMDDRGRAALRRGTIGVVFQQFNLIPSLTVEGNISFQARLSDKEEPGYTEHLCKRLKLQPHLDKYPEALADEPTGNLDEGTAAEVLASMLDLVQDSQAAVLVVTHSEHVAQRMSRRQHLSGGHLA